MENLEITEREVYVYREIYYETVKPMLYGGKSKKEIEIGVKYMCEEFGMTPERYKFMSDIDLIQRLMEIEDSKLVVGCADYVKFFAKQSPELRCPRRTEQKSRKF